MTFDPAAIQALIGLGGSFLITGLVEWIKATFPELDKRWWPTLALAFGLVLNVGWAAIELYAQMTTQPAAVVLFVATVFGLMAGLSASGLYSSGKTLREG
ncbi:MAG: hypothetical protein WC648_05080 [Candidatus Paceibacterota bacterium]|jgi:hypothetical protein